MNNTTLLLRKPSSKQWCLGRPTLLSEVQAGLCPMFVSSRNVGVAYSVAVLKVLKQRIDHLPSLQLSFKVCIQTINWREYLMLTCFLGEKKTAIQMCL